MSKKHKLGDGMIDMALNAVMKLVNSTRGTAVSINTSKIRKVMLEEVKYEGVVDIKSISRSLQLLDSILAQCIIDVICMTNGKCTKIYDKKCLINAVKSIGLV
ncbi:MAG: hypothetical protein JZD41_02560 [Thermoproteus sp.]|nr:hypothetical protein [Thermoproteus sp.]